MSDDYSEIFAWFDRTCKDCQFPHAYTVTRGRSEGSLRLFRETRDGTVYQCDVGEPYEEDHILFARAQKLAASTHDEECVVAKLRRSGARPSASAGPTGGKVATEDSQNTEATKVE